MSASAPSAYPQCWEEGASWDEEDDNAFWIDLPAPPSCRPACHGEGSTPPSQEHQLSSGDLQEAGGKHPFFPHVPAHDGGKLTWQQNFENLQVYKERFGDCDVAQKSKVNTKLGGWVVRAFW